MEHALERSIMERRLSLKKVASVTGAMLALALGAVLLKSESNSHAKESKPQPTATQQPSTTVELTASQLDAIKIGSVGTYEFPVDKETVGNISFADDRAVQVFPS